MLDSTIFLRVARLMYRLDSWERLGSALFLSLQVKNP